MILISAIAVLTSCKTYQAAWDYPQKSYPDRISYQHIEANEIIVKLPDKIYFTANENPFEKLMDSYTYEFVSIKDSRLKMINNYLGPDSVSNYPATCNVTLFKTKHYIEKGYIVPTVLTLSLINLFGFPITSHEVALELKVELVDPEGESYNTYFARGKNKSFAAYYWGYTGVGAANEESKLGEITEKLALKDALEKISSQLIEDQQTKIQD